MRQCPCAVVLTAKYAYIYNPFSDGSYRYRNNNEGRCMKAMVEAARTDAAIAARVQLFRYRVAEELYDLERDPDCLHNLVDSAAHAAPLDDLRKRLYGWMERTNDPLKRAFRQRDDRAAVDAAISAAYSNRPSKKAKPGKRRRGSDRSSTDR